MFTKRLLILNRLMEQAVAGDEGGAGGGAAEGQDTTQQQTQGEASLLQTGKPAEGEQGQQQAATEQHFLPEKFHVKAEDGTIDLEASSKKMAESYANLEKQRGNYEPPPAAAADYTFTPPDELKEVFTADDPMLKGFIEDAHKAGYSQKQIDVAMKHLFPFATGLAAGNATVSQEEAKAELLADWKDEATLNQNLGLAHKAFSAYVDPKDAEAIDKLAGNNPALLRMLAKIGKELREDTPANPSSSVTDSEKEQIEQLMRSEAYTNPKHPDHEKVSKQVSAFYEKTYAKTSQT